MLSSRSGLAFALISAVSFGMSGPIAKGLTDAGWSPESAVLARIVGGAILLVPIVLLVRRRALAAIRRAPAVVVTYGVIAVAGAQVCYFNAIQHLSVGVALMLEYLGPVLVIGWLWATTRRRPHPTTLIGVALAFGGALVVLDVVEGAVLDPIGVAWGLGAAVCLAFYFVISARQDDAVDPLVLSAGGLVVGSVVVAAAGLTGLVPLRASTTDVVLGGQVAPWWVAAAILAAVSGVLAYVFGIAGTRRLGASTASVVALLEVVCAVLSAWWLLGETVTLTQIAGGAAILAGAAVVQSRRSVPPAPELVPVASRMA
ncbi:EamA family transporter [Rhodococcoides corynebacterioides]|uniref:EamA family transporter n=1 Tax=Rhodococcoides corynebacterioides TaxID=53972 RepID=A0ABS7P8P4_9NOCA|nr:DMT family transporter [Rhodococcus corynebacterioides]MBY6367989.1 EamA family transporter [Rhodococcus corynebacterioides]MBY6409543.1 EamA family transporter [Rhodococcus corynebacterioides]